MRPRAVAWWRDVARLGAVTLLATPACASLAMFGMKTAPLPDGPVVFAYDTVGDCKLVATQGPDPQAAPQWDPADDLVNLTLNVIARSTMTLNLPAGPASSEVVQVRDPKGRTAWLRRVAPTGAPAADPLACATPARDVARGAASVAARSLRLTPTAPACRSIRLLTGGVQDVDFQTYSVLARRLFRTAKGPTLGLMLGLEAGATLRSEGGARLLTVSQEDLDACFTQSADEPLPFDREAAFVDWLVNARDEAVAPPNIALTSALGLLGIEEKTCLREGHGETQHRECREAAVGVSPVDKQDLADRTHTLAFVRDRLVDAVHGYGDSLVAAAEVAGRNFVPVPPPGHGAAFAKAFDGALAETVMNTRRQATRGAHGYRLLRSVDMAKVSAPFETVEVDVKTVLASDAPPPAPVAASPTAAATPEAPAAPQPAAGGAPETAGRLKALFAIDAPDCSAAADSAICNAVPSSRLATLSAQYDKPRQPVVRVVDSRRPAATDSHDPTGPSPRRIGEVIVQLSTVAHPGGHAVGERTVLGNTRTPILASPDAPSGALRKDDVDRASARAVVRAIDQALETWMLRPVAHPPPESLRPGTRAFMTLLARHAASNQRVKLITDVLDPLDRPLGPEGLRYPITLPEGSRDRCYAFVAAGSDGAPGDINLVIRHADSDSTALVARDLRSESTAGFNLCHLPPGPYELSVLLAGGVRPSGVVVSMYESTPDKLTNADVRAASDGEPTAMRPAAAATSPVQSAPTPPSDTAKSPPAGSAAH